LAGVIVQGLLGGFRLRLNALLGTDLALIHGLFAQLVFALLVSLALFTSPSWAAQPAGRTLARMGQLRRWSVLTTALVLVQLVFGALLRHTHSALGQRGHIMTAFAVVAAVAWLLKMIVDRPACDKPLAITVAVLAALVGVQVLLGVEALLIRFAAGGLPEAQLVTVSQGIIRTGHFLFGSLIFATAVAACLWSSRRLEVSVRLPVTRAGQLEGAA